MRKKELSEIEAFVMDFRERHTLRFELKYELSDHNTGSAKVDIDVFWVDPLLQYFLYGKPAFFAGFVQMNFK